MPAVESAPPERLPGARLRVLAWVLYDLANTVYIATVTYAFTPFVEREFEQLTGHGTTNFISMLVAAALVPFLGALVDTTARTRRYLVLWTLLCIVALAGWSVDAGSLWLLLCFFVANVAYNVALVFYNALLPSVAPPEQAGRVGGIGVGVGYLGTIIVVLVLLMSDLPPRTFFLIAAVLFLLTALPCMLLVRDLREPQPVRGEFGAVFRAAHNRLLNTLRSLPQNRPLMWFLIGNFCLVDVLNTAVLYFATFTEDVFAGQSIELLGYTFAGPDPAGSFMKIAGLALNVIALAVGLTIGKWTDRAPLLVMRTSALAVLGALIGGTVFGGHSALGYMLTLVALGAFGLTGIWTAGRKVIVLLAPPDQVGSYFGLYGITVKLSVFGALVYAVVHDAFGSRPAMLAQSTQLLIGLGCLFMVRLPASRRSSEA